MSELVPAEEIEAIVGANRHPQWHLGRAVSETEAVYILHSQPCKDSGIDLRKCPYSRALDKGIDVAVWEGSEDTPVVLYISDEGHLVARDPRLA